MSQSPLTSSRTPLPEADPAANPLREITPADLDRLQRLMGYPMVSILLPTHPASRMAPKDIAQVGKLIDHAEQRLACEFPGSQISAVIDPLRSLASRISMSPTGLGLALFSGGATVAAYRLPLAPTPRVVVDPTFATRDLARAVLENPPYCLLTLAAGNARLFIGSGDRLSPLAGGGFPWNAEPDDHADRRGHLHQGERTHRNPRRWDRFVREVDNAVTADVRTKGLPLILAATEPIASIYLNKTHRRTIGTISGNHQRTTPTRLSELARPHIEDYLASERGHALERLEKATNAHRSVRGINDVWQAALDKHVELLLVDPSYVFPALPAPDGRSLTASADPEHPDVLDDAVDEINELVAHGGGSSCFTSLDRDDPGIAAVLRTA